VPTLPAPYGLAALEGHVLVAVAALVVYGAGVDVDLLLGFCGAAVVAAVLLGGHFGGEVCEDGCAGAGVGRGLCVWYVGVGLWVSLFGGWEVFVEDGR
jgi:hypothetical protein